MSIDTKIPLFALACTLIGLAVTASKFLINQIDKSDNIWWPSARKYHSRLTGWTAVTVSLFFSILAYLNYLHDADWGLRILNLIWAAAGLVGAITFAVLQHLIWKGKTFGRLDKIGPLEGSM